MMERVYTIVVCDTEPIAVEGLRALLDCECGLGLISSSASLLEAMETVQATHPDLLVVDKSLGVTAIVEWVENLRLARSSTAVLVWGAQISQSESLRFFHSGACGVVRKTAPLQTLLTSLRTVAAGGSWVDEGTATQLPQRPVRRGSTPLTQRELEVIDLLERGLRNKDIADLLGITAGTVKIHLKHIFEKTGLRGRYNVAVSGLREKSGEAVFQRLV